MNSQIEEHFIFRSILPEEAKEAAEIEKICFPPNEACTAEIMEERARRAQELFLVAEDREKGKLAGFINGLGTREKTLRDDFFKETKLHDPEGENVMILGVDVLPGYRGRGLAREMMRQYAALAARQGRKRLVLTCLEEKVRMYASMGFRDHGMSGSCWGGEQWHEMSRGLGEPEADFRRKEV